MNQKLLLAKRARTQRRKNRVGAKLMGTAQRPRLSVQRSLQHIACQLIDDTVGKTIASSSDVTLKAKGTKTERAQAVGKAIAAAAKEQGITVVVFDRASFRYHGRVKALADAAREGGLQF
jgi:large subunit ribosomal protein L18